MINLSKLKKLTTLIMTGCYCLNAENIFINTLPNIPNLKVADISDNRFNEKYKVIEEVVKKREIVLNI